MVKQGPGQVLGVHGLPQKYFHEGTKLETDVTMLDTKIDFS